MVDKIAGKKGNKSGMVYIYPRKDKGIFIIKLGFFTDFTKKNIEILELCKSSCEYIYNNINCEGVSLYAIELLKTICNNTANNKENFKAKNWEKRINELILENTELQKVKDIWMNTKIQIKDNLKDITCKIKENVELLDFVYLPQNLMPYIPFEADIYLHSDLEKFMIVGISPIKVIDSITDIFYNKGDINSLLDELKGIPLNANNSLKDILKKIAMHSFFTHPNYIKKENVPLELIKESEENIIIGFGDKILNKSEDVVNNMVLGKMKKFYEENCLYEQKFILDENKTIKEICEENNISICALYSGNIYEDNSNIISIFDC